MSKPKIPNQRNEYKKLNARLNKYVLQVEDIYTAITEQAAQMATRVGYEGDREFRFSDYPQIKAQVDEMAANYVADMENLIYAGTSAEWANSNLVQDLLVNKVLKAYNAQVSGEKYKVYYDPNSEHLKAFQQRRDRGMNLSQRLWNQSADMLTELEETISTAIQKGMSAVTLSKRVSKYLQDFPKMQKDYAKRYGKATRSYDCEYRSIRLARSEINMAYRSSENERWRKLDFVVGYEIKVSHKHTVPDICDDLAGKYPKDFEWVGWHPNCTDYKTPILKTEDEFFSIDDKPSVNEVKDVPDSFKQWVRDNQASIKRAEARGTAPYFVRDNRKLVDGLIKGNNTDVKPTAIVRLSTNSDVNLPKGSYEKFDINIFGGLSTYSEQSKFAIDALTSLYGKDVAKKSLVFDAIMRSKSLKDGVKIFRNEMLERGLDDVLESINHLSELQSIDRSKIFAPWVEQFNKYIETINKHNITDEGYIGIYREIEGAYNIYKLSTDERIVKYGLNKISHNTPYSLIEALFEIYDNPFELIADKEFYDAFDIYVPTLIRKHGGTHYDPRYKQVRIDEWDRMSKSVFFTRSVQYHEFAHAMDDLQGLWSYADEWIKLFDLYSDIINNDIGFDAKYMITNGASAKKRLIDAYNKSKRDANAKESAGVLSDIIVALDKNHSSFGFPAHDAKYFSVKKNCLAEFIADASSEFWVENTIFAQSYPELHEAIRKLYKEFFDKYKHK